jgi:GNAT superfamily N-acetyltransferase
MFSIKEDNMASITPTRESVFVRPAWPDEGPLLSALAMRSKAHWGYDDDFMDRCRDELTVTTPKIARSRFRVAQVGREIAGFCALSIEARDASVDDLFVAPDFIGVGVGRILMQDILEYARRHGIRLVHVEADPNAVDFYEREGFQVCGEVPSGSIPGRKLPLMELRF